MRLLGVLKTTGCCILCRRVAAADLTSGGTSWQVHCPVAGYCGRASACALELLRVTRQARCGCLWGTTAALAASSVWPTSPGAFPDAQQLLSVVGCSSHQGSFQNLISRNSHHPGPTLDQCQQTGLRFCAALLLGCDQRQCTKGFKISDSF